MAYTNAQKKQHIKEIQTYLYAISLFDSRIPPIIPDGNFGSETAVTVRAFQQQYGLSDTGNVDSATWNKIVSVYREFLKASPRPLACFPSDKHKVRSGDKGELVCIIQSILRSLQKYYDNFPIITSCGTYGDDTMKAVMMFQRKVGLPQNGIVDCKTWNMLVTSFEHVSATM